MNMWKSKVNALKRLQAETAAELDAFSPPSLRLRQASVFALLRRDKSARQATAPSKGNWLDKTVGKT